jgi:hypothetical protein
MSSSPETNTIQVYFKIPYTEITTVVNVEDSLTTMEFLEYVNTNVRNNLNINQKYDIEIVDTDKTGGELAAPMEPRYDETLLQRYGNTNQIISFYARPVHPITGEFIRQNDYSN